MLEQHNRVASAMAVRTGTKGAELCVSWLTKARASRFCLPPVGGRFHQEAFGRREGNYSLDCSVVLGIAGGDSRAARGRVGKKSKQVARVSTIHSG